jgi:hypothetical protein
MYGGSQSTIYPSAEWGGRVGQIDYYATGEYLQNAEGIENPAAVALHPACPALAIRGLGDAVEQKVAGRVARREIGAAVIG